MGARHTQRVPVMPHDGAPGLGTLVNGDAPGNGSGDLGIAVVNGGGTDDQVAVPKVFCIMANGHRNAQAPQMLHGGAFCHIGTLNQQSLAPQHLCQGAHGNAADAHQMHAFAGEEIFGNGMRIIHHGNLPFQK